MNKWTDYKILIVLNLLVLLFSFSSCSDESIVTEETVPMEDMTWDSSDTISFDFEVKDTTSYLDFYLNLRITTSYPWSNCYVFTQLTSPTMVALDTINIPLADPATGRWNGEVSGSMVENHVLFMRKVRFHELGDYKISFVQGMRDEQLSDISDVGFTIKKSEQ